MLTIFLFASAANVLAQKQVPQFKNYPAGEVFRGKNAPVKLTRADMLFRTRLRYAAKQKPNFAGHYVLNFWGCGTECLSGAAVDVKTGKVVWVDFSICCWQHYREDDFEPVKFRLDSNLIEFTGLRDEKEDDFGRHFYKIQNGQFVFIKTLPDKDSQEQK